jgi:hypothetical protein
MRWQPNRLDRPRPGTWSSISWPVWLAIAAALVAWQIADANYLSAGIFIVLFAIAAALRVRERQRAREEG